MIIDVLKEEQYREERMYRFDSTEDLVFCNKYGGILMIKGDGESTVLCHRSEVEYFIEAVRRSAKDANTEE